MELIGDRPTEDGKCLAVEGLQGTGGEVHRDLSGHVQILVKDEFYFLVLLTATLHHTGACMDLSAAAASKTDLCVNRRSANGILTDFFITKQA